MTAEERNICVTTGTSILALDLEAIAANLYPDSDLSSVYIDGFTLPELFTMLRRAIKQLLHELKSDSWKILPNLVVDANELLTDQKDNTVLLTRQLEYIYYSLYEAHPSDVETCAPEIQFLARYEMQLGFWDRSKTKLHDSNSTAILKAQSEASLLVRNLASSLRKADSTREHLNELINNLDEYTVQKEQDFTSLERNVELTSQSLTEVRNSEKEAAISNSKIAVLLEQTNKALDESREQRIQDRQNFTFLEEQLKLLADSSAQSVNSLAVYGELFDSIVKSAREKEQHILDQEARIVELIGFAADGTLGGVFNRRKKELQWPVYLWTVLSLASVGLAVYWVLYVFKQTPSQDHNGVNWLILAANVVRTSPVFLLVYFCLSQYTKERNIQEEYAFKAAISMTVTAYADMIGDGEVNERVKMLMDTIQRIYVPPVLGKVVKPISLKSKHLAQATKNMADTAANLKTAVTDTLKNIKPDKPA